MRELLPTPGRFVWGLTMQKQNSIIRPATDAHQQFRHLSPISYSPGLEKNLLAIRYMNEPLPVHLWQGQRNVWSIADSNKWCRAFEPQFLCKSILPIFRRYYDNVGMMGAPALQCRPN